MHFRYSFIDRQYIITMIFRNILGNGFIVVSCVVCIQNGRRLELYLYTNIFIQVHVFTSSTMHHELCI